MLLYVSIKVACGSVSFPRLRGKVGMGDSAQRPTQRAEANAVRKRLKIRRLAKRHCVTKFWMRNGQ